MIKNILVLEDSSKAKFGGGQKVTLEVIDALKNEYNLYLVDCSQDSIFKQKAKVFLKGILSLSCYGKVIGGEKSAFSLGLKEITVSPFLYIQNIIKVLSFIKSNDFTNNNTLIYATTKKQLLLSWILKKLTNIKYIYHAHAFDDRKSLFFKLIYPAYKKADIVICVSNLIKNNINLPNCQTIYNPIKAIETKTKTIKNKDKIIISSFSTLIKWKGIEYFMQSFEYLQNKDKVELWIFGDGSEKEYLKQFTNEKVILKGFASNSEELMLNDIDIVVVSSITEEACPMVPLEAFKCGVPVISTNIGGQAEIVKDEEVGLYVDIKNSEQIAQKIDYLIEYPNIYEKLSKNAISYSKKFDINKYQINILNIFKEIEL